MKAKWAMLLALVVFAGAKAKTEAPMRFPRAMATISMPDTLTATPGSIVNVPITLSLAGDSVAALGAVIKATNGILSFSGFTPGAIIPGERFNVNAVTPDSILLAYTDFGGGPIQKDGVLATLQFRISETAKDGEVAKINFSGVFATDPQFQNLPILPISGQVTIVIQPVIFSIPDTLSGAPGDTIAVPVMLARHEHRIDALGSAIKAGNRLLSYVRFVAGAIIPGQQFNVSVPVPDSVRLAYLNLGDGPIANDGVLVTLYFRIDPNAKNGDISMLSFHDLTASDSTFKKLPVQNFSGNITVVIEPPVSAGQEKNFMAPKNFMLFQNYPNPFWNGAASRSAGNHATTIKYGVPRQSRVKLEVINALGMRVAILTDEIHQPGYYELKLDMAGLPGGIYFYRLTSSAGLVETRKLLLVK